MGIKILTHVLHDGEAYAPDTVISEKSMSEKQMQRLINIGAAEKTGEDPDSTPGKVDIEDSIDKPGLSDADDLMTDEDVYKELDEAFSHAELKREAEALEMDFANNISKKDLLQKIIDEEKEEHFFDLLENS